MYSLKWGPLVAVPVLLILCLFSLSSAQQNTGTLLGTLTDSRDRPVADAHIVLGSNQYYTISDGQGQFRIDGILSGSYSLALSRIGYKSVRREIEIKSGEETDLDIQLEPTSYTGGSVVVTATRTRKDIEEVPVPVTVVPQKEIKSTGSLRLSDVLAEQTGLVLTSDHGTGIQVQGFDSDYTLIMLNGQPMIGRTAGTLDLSRISVGNVEQVEMIKGPSSALWGSDALAGVINIITEEGTRPFEIGVSSRYGSNHTLDVGTNFSFRTDRWQNDLYMNRNSSGGYRLNPESISQTVPEYENYTASYRTEWDIASGVSMELQTRYYREEQQGTDFTGSVENPTLLDSEAMQEDYSIAPILNVRPFHRMDMTFSYHGSRYRTDSRWEYRDDGELYDREKFDQNYNKAEFQSTYRWNESQTSTLGSGVNWEKLRAERYDGNPSFTNLYLFAQHEWRPLEQLDLIAGFRYDEHSEYESRFSPKISARYKLTDWLHVRGSAGSGFKAPDFRQLFLNFTNPTIGYSVYGSSTVAEHIHQLEDEGKIEEIFIPLSSLEEIRAERSWAYNAGLNLMPLSKLEIRLNLFHNDVNDLIETAPIARKTNGQSAFSYFNLEEIYTRGLETEVRWSPLNSLNLSVGYQLLDARRKVEETRTVQNEQGEVVQREFVSYEPMFNRSRHSGTVKLFYENEQYGLEANVRGTIRGRYGRLDANGNGFVDSGEYENAYTLWDLAVAKSFSQRYRLQLGVDNVLDFTRPGDLSYLPGRIFYAQVSLQLY